MEHLFSESGKPLKQVLGWSIHSKKDGIAGPLFVDEEKGALYFLDVKQGLGFAPFDTFQHAIHNDCFLRADH